MVRVRVRVRVGNSCLLPVRARDGVERDIGRQHDATAQETDLGRGIGLELEGDVLLGSGWGWGWGWG